MSVLGLLLVLGSVVAVLTNIWRHGNIDLTGKDANVRGVYARSIAIGVALAALLRANVIDIARNPDGPVVYLGWLNVPWGANAPLADKAVVVLEEVVGILVTGIVAAFVAKFLNDAFDVLYELKRWTRGHANSMKPEPSTRTRSVTRRRAPRRRGGGGGGGSEEGNGERRPVM